MSEYPDLKSMSTQERVFKIATALGSGGRCFTTEEIVKVSNFIDRAEFDYTLALMILNGAAHVAFDENGEMTFSNDPDKFVKK